MDLAALKNELTAGHPDTGPYSADDATAADQLNARNREPNRVSVDAQTLMSALDEAEYNALVARGKAYWGLLIQAGGVQLTAIVRNQLSTLFPNPSNTRTNLLALLKRPGSRAEELGLGFITPSDVANARRL